MARIATLPRPNEASLMMTVCPSCPLGTTQAQEQQTQLLEMQSPRTSKRLPSQEQRISYVELGIEGKLSYRIKKKFPLQIGREILVSEATLDIPEKADRRQCQTSKEEEEVALACRFQKTLRSLTLDNQPKGRMCHRSQWPRRFFFQPVLKVKLLRWGPPCHRSVFPTDLLAGGLGLSIF